MCPIIPYQEQLGNYNVVMVFSDGKTIIRESITGTAEQCESLGETLANRLSELGGKAILEEIRMELTR